VSSGADSKFARRIIAGAAALFVCLAVAFGRSSLPLARALAGNGGAVSGRSPDLVEREQWARAVLASAESESGADSLETADAMMRLAMALGFGARDADLAEVRRLAGRAIEIREAILGTDDPQVAAAMADYVGVLWSFRRYEEARPLAERALSIRLRSSREEDPALATSLYQLAALLNIEGDYAAAEPLYRRALAVWRRAPGDHRQDMASALHYMGVVRWNIGDTDGARRLIDESLAILQEALGTGHPLVAQRLALLGALSEAAGDRAGARVLYERAGAVWSKALGPDHPHVARSLTSLGNLQLKAGNPEAAKPFFDRALAIRIKAFGPAHPLVAHSLGDLGRVAEARGNGAEAERLMKDAVTILRKDPPTVAVDLASALIDLARVERSNGETARALALSIEGERRARTGFRRGSRGMPEADALRYQAIRTGGLDLALTALLELTGPRDEETAAVFGEVIRSRGLVFEEVARVNATGTPVGAPDGTGETIDPVRLQAALPPGSALVAYVRYEEPGRAGRVSRASYAAFVVEPVGSAPRVVGLGSADLIDALVGAWRAEAGADPRLRGTRRAEEAYRAAGERLRAAVWDPLADRMAGRRRVFLVPDGALGLVSFAALPAGAGRYMIEAGPRFDYLSAERDLLAAPRPRPAGAGALVMGAADFDTAEEPASVARDAADRTPPCGAVDALAFAPLPGTAAEAAEVATMMGRASDVTVLTGSLATESAFRRLAPGRSVIHLATHGWFLGGGCHPDPGGVLVDDDELVSGEDPLLLSGLAFAGANRRMPAGRDSGDGLLTAREVSGLDLSSVDWAVLSGCETGVGRVMDGEGVLGLRRAFHAAGAGTLIMSLWPVDDGAARAWMRGLYEGRLNGLPTDEAVAEAGLGLLRTQRQRGATTHPFFWGGFVAAGDWR